MSTVSDRYSRLADALSAKIAAVAPERWTSPSPCEDWTARDVVRHVIDTHGMFLGFVGQELGSIPSVDDDPAGAFAGARRPSSAAAPDRANSATGSVNARSSAR